VYDSKARRYAKDNRTQSAGKSEAEVTNNKNCARSIVLLKLTTEREASRGLFATVELLVLSVVIELKNCS